jgi:hypothetical protein
VTCECVRARVADLVLCSHRQPDVVWRAVVCVGLVHLRGARRDPVARVRHETGQARQVHCAVRWYHAHAELVIARSKQLIEMLCYPACVQLQQKCLSQSRQPSTITTRQKKTFDAPNRNNNCAQQHVYSHHYSLTSHGLTSHGTRTGSSPKYPAIGALSTCANGMPMVASSSRADEKRPCMCCGASRLMMMPAATPMGYARAVRPSAHTQICASARTPDLTRDTRSRRSCTPPRQARRPTQTPVARTHTSLHVHDSDTAY